MRGTGGDGEMPRRGEHPARLCASAGVRLLRLARRQAIEYGRVEGRHADATTLALGSL